MKEIEVKILNINPNEITKKLHSISAKKLFEGTIHSYYYDYKDESLRDKGIRFRLRDYGDKVVLTLKEKQDDKVYQVCNEHEIHVSNKEETEEIIKKLGLELVRKETRKRTSYKLENAIVEIDEYEDIPPLLEIESTSKDEIQKLIAFFGYKPEDAKPWSGAKVKKWYEKQKKK
ncbi:MAG: class IV adenylate cyclase [Candidatus Woesearchaeota archaeon]